MDTKKIVREDRILRHSPNNKINSIVMDSHTGTDPRPIARGNKRNGRATKGSRTVYIAAGFGVVVLLLCAFYLPQLLFQARDNVLCSDTVLSERESVDVLIGDFYELSLYNRMFNFAEGLSKGVSYYVSEQDMEVDEELYDLLIGLEVEPIGILMDFRLINPYLMEEFMIQRQKQYVIYSDDYAQGVNFRIWYLELTGPYEERLELLMDAETYTIYGIRAERNSLMTQEEIDSWMYYIWSGSLASHLLNSGLENVNQLWLYLAMEYEAVSMSEFEAIYTFWEDFLYGSDITSEERLGLMRVLSEGEWLDENNLVITLPYEEYFQTIKLQLTPEEPWPTYRYHDVFYGIESICRMIPEFMEEN